MRAALREAGWEVLRRRGSHEVWGKPGANVRIVVAGKASDTVPVGTLSTFAEQAVWSILREAVGAYAREMLALGQPLPKPVAATGTIEAA